MKFFLVAILFLASCTPVLAVETFDQAWANRWASKVEGSLFTRRFEPQIKEACKEVWDVAQANVPLKPAGPLIAKNKAIVKVSAKAAPRRRAWRRRRLFR